MEKSNNTLNIRNWSKTVIDSIEKIFFGKKEAIEKILVAMLCGGHVLIEDVPGVGKTILARAIAISFSGKFSRIQCTPDLLPTDVLGVSIYNPKEGNFKFRAGPIISNIVLVDEINRATPRTQSALLEAMAENQITVEGKVFKLPEPFFLIATENPIEFEGTFPLPEAQKDRFFLSIEIGYPSRNAESLILETQRRTTHPITDLKAATDLQTIIKIKEDVVKVEVDNKLRDYIIDIVEASRNNKMIQLGISPRGSLALYKGAQALAAIRGRDFVTPEDIKELVVPIFLKRIILSSEYLIKGETVKDVLKNLLETVDVPVLKDAI